MIYKPKHFSTKELVPDSFYAKWGETSLQFMNAGLLHDLDVIRDELGEPLIVNNSSYNWSGLRTPDWQHYSPTSQHSFGNAVDIKLVSWVRGDLTTRSPESVRQEIKAMKKAGKLAYITGLEEGTSSWCHIDVRNREPNDPCGLFLFSA